MFVSDFDTRAQFEIFEQTAEDGNSYVGIIYDDIGNQVIGVPSGSLLLVPYSKADYADTDIKVALTHAYASIDCGTSLTRLSFQIETYIPTLYPDLTVDDFKVAYLDYISLIGTYAEYLNKDGYGMEVVFTVKTNQNYIVMYAKDAREGWEVLDSSSVEVTSDGIMLYLNRVPLLLAILEQQ